MPTQLAPIGTELPSHKNDPISHQVYNAFETYLPKQIEQHLRELNLSQPIAGLEAQIAKGQVTKGQWLLYTTVCFSGQVMNGGVEGFLGNCVGLIADVRSLIASVGPPDFSEVYRDAAGPFLDVIDQIHPTERFVEGDNLRPFWSSIDAAWDNIDKVSCDMIESHAYAKDRDTDPTNWFLQVDKAVLDWVTSKPGQFLEL